MKPRSHWVTCWQVHDACALRVSVDRLSARILHDQDRRGLYRRAMNTPGFDAELRDEAVQLARTFLTELASSPAVEVLEDSA